uniref:Ig-like domain-containing protein n=1 Tax=Chelonoidis abingdonii TaxID=106734 RepID=A0A8C0GXL4_CHEAB
MLDIQSPPTLLVKTKTKTLLALLPFPHFLTDADSVTQPEGTVTIHEGKPVLLYCTYDYSGSPALYWYAQYPHEVPRLLLTQYGASDEEEKRRRRGFSAKLEKDSKSFHLEKNSSEVSDSAVYYCALRDTGSKATWELNKNLPD